MLNQIARIEKLDGILGLEKPMYSVVEMMTPERAKEILANQKNPRRISPPRVRVIARDIKNGKWKVTHQGIAFDVNGILRDGQHRLSAICMAGIPVQIYVTYNASEESLLHVDCQMKRSSYASMAAAGIDVKSKHMIPIANVIEILPASRPGRYSPDELVSIIGLYEDAILFSLDNLKKKIVSTAWTRCAVARAYYHVDHGILSQFCSILESGKSGCVDAEVANSAIWMRNWLFENQKGHGSAMGVERYRRCQQAIAKFASGTPAYLIRGTDKDLFPLPPIKQESEID